MSEPNTDVNLVPEGGFRDEPAPIHHAAPVEHTPEFKNAQAELNRQTLVKEIASEVVAQQTAALPVKTSADYPLGSEENARLVLEEARRRNPEHNATSEKFAAIQQQLRNDAAYRKSNEAPSAIEQVKKLAEESSGIHDLVGKLREPAAEETSEENQSDFDATAFAAGVGFDGAENLGFATADDALQLTRECVEQVMNTVPVDDVVKILDEFPALHPHLMDEIGKQLSNEATARYGYHGEERTQEQTDNLDALATGVLRQMVAHSRLGKPRPMIEYVKRARLLQDPEYLPGKRGAAKPTTAAPKQSFANIYQVCQALHNI